jgi:hypothetical protein
MLCFNFMNLSHFSQISFSQFAGILINTPTARYSERFARDDAPFTTLLNWLCVWRWQTSDRTAGIAG